MAARMFNIPITKPWMDEREVAAAGRPLLSGWVTQGPEVAAFEKICASSFAPSYQRERAH